MKRSEKKALRRKVRAFAASLLDTAFVPHILFEPGYGAEAEQIAKDELKSLADRIRPQPDDQGDDDA